MFDETGVYIREVNATTCYGCESCVPVSLNGEPEDEKDTLYGCECELLKRVIEAEVIESNPYPPTFLIPPNCPFSQPNLVELIPQPLYAYVWLLNGVESIVVGRPFRIRELHAYMYLNYGSLGKSTLVSLKTGRTLNAYIDGLPVDKKDPRLK